MEAWFEPSSSFSDDVELTGSELHSKDNEEDANTVSILQEGSLDTATAALSTPSVPATTLTMLSTASLEDPSTMELLAPHSGAVMMPGTTPPQIGCYSSSASGTTRNGMPIHPSYFHPVNHHVQCAYHPNDYVGHIFTQGMHSQGYPDLFAAGVPRHRAAMVVKNMRFLTSRMIGGIPVLSGHRSTDADYRVKISEIEDECYRQNILLRFICNGCAQLKDARVMELKTYYQDAEDWGSFPPAPEGLRETRNRLLNTIFFPAYRAYGGGSIVNDGDVAYMVRNFPHFCRILGFRGNLQRLVENLPVGDLKYKLHSYITTLSFSSLRILEARNSAVQQAATNNMAHRVASVNPATVLIKIEEPEPSAATASTNTLPKKKPLLVKSKKQLKLGGRDPVRNSRRKANNKKPLAQNTGKENAINHSTKSTKKLRPAEKELLYHPAPSPPSPEPASSSAIVATFLAKDQQLEQQPPANITEWVASLPPTPIISNTKPPQPMGCSTALVSQGIAKESSSTTTSHAMAIQVEKMPTTSNKACK